MQEGIKFLRNCPVCFLRDLILRMEEKAHDPLFYTWYMVYTTGYRRASVLWLFRRLLQRISSHI